MFSLDELDRRAAQNHNGSSMQINRPEIKWRIKMHTNSLSSLRLFRNSKVYNTESKRQFYQQTQQKDILKSVENYIIDDYQLTNV